MIMCTCICLINTHIHEGHTPTRPVHPHVNSHENADLDSSDKRPKKDTQVKSMGTHIHTRVCTRRHVCVCVYVCVCGQGEGEKTIDRVGPLVMVNVISGKGRVFPPLNPALTIRSIKLCHGNTIFVSQFGRVCLHTKNAMPPKMPSAIFIYTTDLISHLVY